MVKSTDCVHVHTMILYTIYKGNMNDREEMHMKIGFNEATALECKGQSLMADLEMCEKYGFDYIEIRFDCLKEYLKEHTLEELIKGMRRENRK